jgi:hypothetical protein
VGDFQIVAETEKVALKKSRTTKAPTPSKYSKITKVKLATVSLGNNYEEEVRKRQEAEGKEANFEAKKTYCFPLTRIETGLRGLAEGLLKKFGLKIEDKLSKVIYKKNDSDQLYVRVYPNLAKEYKSNSVYFDNDGNQLTKEEFEAIEAEYLPLDKKIGKGENNAEKFIDCIDNSQGGIEEKIIVNNYKIENILYLGDNDKNPINDLTEEKLKLVA